MPADEDPFGAPADGDVVGHLYSFGQSAQQAVDQGTLYLQPPFGRPQMRLQSGDQPLLPAAAAAEQPAHLLDRDVQLPHCPDRLRRTHLVTPEVPVAAHRIDERRHQHATGVVVPKRGDREAAGLRELPDRQ